MCFHLQPERPSDLVGRQMIVRNQCTATKLDSVNCSHRENNYPPSAIALSISAFFSSFLNEPLGVADTALEAKRERENANLTPSLCSRTIYK